MTAHKPYNPPCSVTKSPFASVLRLWAELLNGVAGLAPYETKLDLETIFAAQYERIARVISRMLRDPARAEELAVEVFLKWSRTPEPPLPLHRPTSADSSDLVHAIGTV